MIGVVGPDPGDAFADALDRLEAASTVGPAEAVVDADPDAVVAVGEPATIDLARAGVEAPILPVDAGRGLASLPRERALRGLERVVAGEFSTFANPVLEVRLGDEPTGRALFDAMLVASDPGRISEYEVVAGEPIDRFRADGVVVATPAGSYGYANAAGGPLLERGGDLLAVVPVGAFAIRADHWAFDRTTTLTLTIERDEGDVSLLLDDRERTAIPRDRPVEVRAPDALATIHLPDA